MISMTVIDEPIEVPRLEDIYVPLPDASVDEVSSILVHQAPHQQPDNNISLEYFPKIKPSQA